MSSLFKTSCYCERNDNNMKVSKWKSTMFIAPFLVCFGLFWLAPFVYGIYMSLHKLSLTRGNMGFIGLQNFLDLFNKDSMYSEAFFLGLKNTVIFVLVSVPLVLSIALYLRFWLIIFRKKSRDFSEPFSLCPMQFPLLLYLRSLYGSSAEMADLSTICL